MFGKKLILAGTAGVLAVSLLVLPAQAHGHGHGGRHHRGSNTNGYVAPAAPPAADTPAAEPDVPAATNPSTAYPVCPVEGCAETGPHIHDNNYYCGYHHAGGYCDGSCVGAVADNNTAPVNPPAADSGTAYPVCPVEGCAETGHHVHDNNYYCGYHHAGGYCDGSCVGVAAAGDSAVVVTPPANNTPAVTPTVSTTAYPVCPVEGCVLAGHHLHDGSYYCGYHHADGYCDGSCANSAAGPRYGRGNGCHRHYATKLVYCR